MTRTILLAAAIACLAAPVHAQTKGRVSVGASVTYNFTPDGDAKSGLGFGPLIRLNPRKGWGLAGALNWFNVDLEDPTGADGDFARLRTRPLMGGVAYSLQSGPVMTSFSIVAGPSFNRARFHDDFVARLPSGGVSLDVDNSLAVRPGIGITWTVAPRAAIVGFGGYLINRPDVVYRDRFGNQLRDHWKADSIVLSVGAVYSLF